MTDFTDPIVNDDKYITDNIRITDLNNGLKVYHYNLCDESYDNNTKNSRGIIRDGDTVVCKSFNYTLELFSNDEQKIKDTIESVFNKCKFYVAHEVTLLRVWFYKEKWVVSTHKKVDAYKSYWGCPISHGTKFENALKYKLQKELSEYLDTLDKSKIYTFIVRTDCNNRIVCEPDKDPVIYTAGEFSNYQDANPFVLQDANTTGLSRPDELKFENVDQLLLYVTTLDPSKSQGIMIYVNEGTSDFYNIKITNKNYKELSDIRNNCSSLNFRYVQVRNDHELKEKFIKLYPEHADNFINYEMVLCKIVESIYRGYVMRYINHEFVMLPQEQWFVCKDLHDLFIADPVKNRISLKLVTDYINNLSPVRVNYLIKHFLKPEEKDQISELKIKIPE